MVILTFDNKTIKCTSNAPIYQYDTNIDLIKSILPVDYDGTNLNNATVILCYKNSLGKGSYIKLEKSSTPYDSSRNQYFDKINSKLTSVAGKLTLWLKITDDTQNFNFQTGESTVDILPSKEIPKQASIESASYFDQCLMKMNQLKNAANNAVISATEQANSARAEVQKINDAIIQINEKINKLGVI